ncbi:MAG: hypothetical protein LUH18_09055 [Oscillospiraceae bacterium]|nr:hypothetical protein [Oscillospiraceae bacterium]
MERNLLVGNGINIQFGGADAYSNSAIMARVVENIKAGKYTPLTENSLTVDEQLGNFEGLVQRIDKIKEGKLANFADGLFMLTDMDRIKMTYPDKSSITSVFMEDYFLAFELMNNIYKAKDGEEISEFHRKIMFELLRQMLVDGIYNDGLINDVWKNYYSGVRGYLEGFSSIFTTNYDYNLESILGNENSAKVCHLHGEFNKLAPKYDTSSEFYAKNQAECDALISRKITGMDHVYSDAVMSWSWLDKYGAMIEPDSKEKEERYKAISGRLEIIGLAPGNDEHLFLLVDNNPKIQSVIYYYKSDEERSEMPHHLHKHVTYQRVDKLWESLK